MKSLSLAAALIALSGAAASAQTAQSAGRIGQMNGACGQPLALTYSLSMPVNQVAAAPLDAAFLRAEPGDTVRFVPTDKSHNVEGVKGMLPEGVAPFRSQVNEEYVLTLTEGGVYGVKCTPHYSMGMVMLIQAGPAPANLDAAAAMLASIAMT